MTNNSRQRPLFTMGQIYMTPGAETALDEADQSPFAFLTRHIAGDWGELPIEDLNANQEAVEQGLRILSRYTTTLILGSSS